MEQGGGPGCRTTQHAWSTAAPQQPRGGPSAATPGARTRRIISAASVALSSAACLTLNASKMPSCTGGCELCGLAGWILWARVCARGASTSAKPCAPALQPPSLRAAAAAAPAACRPRRPRPRPRPLAWPLGLPRAPPAAATQSPQSPGLGRGMAGCMWVCEGWGWGWVIGWVGGWVGADRARVSTGAVPRQPCRPARRLLVSHPTAHTQIHTHAFKGRMHQHAPALSQMMVGIWRSARANAAMASDFLPGVRARGRPPHVPSDRYGRRRLGGWGWVDGWVGGWVVVRHARGCPARTLSGCCLHGSGMPVVLQAPPAPRCPRRPTTPPASRPSRRRR